MRRRPRCEALPVLPFPSPSRRPHSPSSLFTPSAASFGCLVAGFIESAQRAPTGAVRCGEASPRHRLPPAPAHRRRGAAQPPSRASVCSRSQSRPSSAAIGSLHVREHSSSLSASSARPRSAVSNSRSCSSGFGGSSSHSSRRCRAAFAVSPGRRAARAARARRHSAAHRPTAPGSAAGPRRGGSRP